MAAYSKVDVRPILLPSATNYTATNW